MRRLLWIGLCLGLLGCPVEGDDDDTSAGDDDAGDDDAADDDAGDDDTDLPYTMPFEIAWFEWAHVPGGAAEPTIDTFRGKVLMLMLFQKW